MSKHSPGPWTFENRMDDCDKSSAIYAKDGRIFEEVCIIPHDDMTEEGEPVVAANARLIAAAPELFAAVRALIIQTSDWDIKDIQDLGMETTLQMAREAMVKATSSTERSAP